MRRKHCKRAGENARENMKHRARKLTRSRCKESHAKTRRRRKKIHGRSESVEPGNQVAVRAPSASETDVLDDRVDCGVGIEERAEPPLVFPGTQKGGWRSHVEAERSEDEGEARINTQSNLGRENQDARRPRAIEDGTASALNFATRIRRRFIPLVSTKSPREGASLVAGAAEFL